MFFRLILDGQRTEVETLQLINKLSMLELIRHMVKPFQDFFLDLVISTIIKLKLVDQKLGFKGILVAKQVV